MPTIINLRVDEIDGEADEERVHCTLIMDDEICGELILRIGEYQQLGAALLLGISPMKGHLEDKSDDHVYKEWINREEGKMTDETKEYADLVVPNMEEVVIYRWPSSQICMDCEHGEFVQSKTFNSNDYICWAGCVENRGDFCPRHKIREEGGEEDDV